MTPEVLMLLVSNIIAVAALLVAVLVPLHLSNRKRFDRLESGVQALEVGQARLEEKVNFWDRIGKTQLTEGPR